LTYGRWVQPAPSSTATPSAAIDVAVAFFF
jgi:hypothetical protein